MLMAVPIDTDGSGPSVGNPRELFSLEATGFLRFLRPYDVAPDGQSFVLMRGEEEAREINTLTFVQNWIGELR
jgi:hypothetical protein